MAEKNIQIKNLTGDLLFPKTKGAVVFNNAGENLGGVEAGAQVNIIEAIKIDGVALNIVDKVAEYTTPAAVEYTIVKAETADEGMSATYQLAKDGVAFGTKINIAKDMVVSGGELKYCAVKDQPIAGLEVGDPYIELTIANNDGTKLYIPVKGLVDIYTAGDDTIVIEDHKIKVSLTELQKTFYTEAEVDALLAEKQDNLTEAQMAAVNSEITKAIKEGYDAHLANTVVHVTADDKATWTAKQDALTTEQLAAVNSGIDAEAKAKYDGYEATIQGLADDKAEDDEVLHLAGAETVTGAKAFQAGLTNGKTIAANDDSTECATTKWVNAAVATAIAGNLTYEVIA